MSKVNCIYCGGEIAEGLPHCPHCGAISHFQKKGERAGARRRFLIFFMGVVIFCGAMILWLPR